MLQHPATEFYDFTAANATVLGARQTPPYSPTVPELPMTVVTSAGVAATHHTDTHHHHHHHHLHHSQSLPHLHSLGGDGSGDGGGSGVGGVVAGVGAGVVLGHQNLDTSSSLSFNGLGPSTCSGSGSSLTALVNHPTNSSSTNGSISASGSGSGAGSGASNTNGSGMLAGSASSSSTSSSNGREPLPSFGFTQEQVACVCEVGFTLFLLPII